MRLDLLEPPDSSDAVVELTEAGEHMRVDTEEEGLAVARMIRAATQVFEEETGRQILTAKWRLYLRRFPLEREPIRIPKPPLQQIDQIQYLDPSGNLETWDPSEYTVIAPSGPFARHGVVFPAPGHVYPSCRWADDGVRVDFTAGWGTSNATPESVRDAILAIATGLYEFREPMFVATVSTANRSFERLLARHRLPVMA